VRFDLRVENLALGCKFKFNASHRGSPDIDVKVSF